MKTFFLTLFSVVFFTFSAKSQLACYANVNAAISIDGTVDLRPIDLLYSEMNPDHTYTMSRSHFNCADVGNTYMIIISEYSGSTLINLCYNMVTIENKFEGVIPCGVVRAWCRDVTLPLNSSGDLTLTPELLAGGPVSPAFNYTVSPSHLDCSNLGLNEVNLTVTSTNNVSQTCTANVTVTNPTLVISPCYLLYARYFRFIPENIFNYPIIRGSIIPFELAIEKDPAIKKQISGEIKMVLSKDEIISKEDIGLFSKKVIFKNKDLSLEVNNKFTIPSNTLAGDYYFIMDVISDNKKENVGFKRVVQKVTINNFITDNTNQRSQISPTINNIEIYPNPFADNIKISTKSGDDSTIELFDAVGKLWKKKRLYGGVEELNVIDLPKGIYFAKISNLDGKAQVFKLLSLNE